MELTKKEVSIYRSITRSIVVLFFNFILAFVLWFFDKINTLSACSLALTGFVLCGFYMILKTKELMKSEK